MTSQFPGIPKNLKLTLFYSKFLIPSEFIGRTDAEAEAPILCPPDATSWPIGKDPDAGKDWGQKQKGATGWDAWMASLTQWTWVWANSGRWWRTGKPGVLQSVGSPRVRLDWVTEQWKQRSPSPGIVLGKSGLLICMRMKWTEHRRSWKRLNFALDPSIPLRFSSLLSSSFSFLLSLFLSLSSWVLWNNACIFFC